jgi:hypothetical protein
MWCIAVQIALVIEDAPRLASGRGAAFLKPDTKSCRQSDNGDCKQRCQVSDGPGQLIPLH